MCAYGELVEYLTKGGAASVRGMVKEVLVKSDGRRLILYRFSDASTRAVPSDDVPEALSSASSGSAREVTRLVGAEMEPDPAAVGGDSLPPAEPHV